MKSLELERRNARAADGYLSLFGAAHRDTDLWLMSISHSFRPKHPRFCDKNARKGSVQGVLNCFEEKSRSKHEIRRGSPTQGDKFGKRDLTFPVDYLDQALCKI